VVRVFHHQSRWTAYSPGRYDPGTTLGDTWPAARRAVSSGPATAGGVGNRARGRRFTHWALIEGAGFVSTACASGDAGIPSEAPASCAFREKKKPHESLHRADYPGETYAWAAFGSRYPRVRWPLRNPLTWWASSVHPLADKRPLSVSGLRNQYSTAGAVRSFSRLAGIKNLAGFQYRGLQLPKEGTAQGRAPVGTTQGALLAQRWFTGERHQV